MFYPKRSNNAVDVAGAHCFRDSHARVCVTSNVQNIATPLPQYALIQNSVARNICEIFVGIDVIGNWLTEINVTSPTGIQELERFNKENIAELIWEAIENKKKV